MEHQPHSVTTVQIGQETPQGTPAHASAQRDVILQLLKAAKACGRGVDRAYLIFERHFTQCGTRIFELEQMGYVIRHETRPGQRYVTYFLVSEPAEEKPLPAYQPKGRDKRQSAFVGSSDWFTQETGRERPKEPRPSLGPLFERTGDG